MTCARVAILALLPLALAGCAKVPERAAHYARSETKLTFAVVPLAELPHRLCVRNAQYAFLAQSLTGEAPIIWSDWYATTDAGQRITWQRLCDIAEEESLALRHALRAMRVHANALDSLAAGRPLDTSGLEKLASGAGTSATTAGFTASASTITSVGSGLSSAASKFLEWYRQGKLDAAISASDACIQRVCGDLRAVVSDAQDELDHVKVNRKLVLGLLRKQNHADAQAQILTRGFELSLDVDTEFGRESGSLARYGAAIERLAEAHHRLAELARGDTPAATTDAALSTLDSALDDLLDEEWNR